MNDRQFHDGLKSDKAKDEEWTDAAAYFTKEKRAFGNMAMPCSPGDGQKGWIGQFEGSPLMEQAVALERHEIQMEAEDIAQRQQERAQNQSRMDQDQARWDARDQIRIQKRQLELQLAEQHLGNGQASDPIAELGNIEAQAGEAATGGAEPPATAPGTGMPKMAAHPWNAFKNSMTKSKALDGAKALIPPALGALGTGTLAYLASKPRAELGGISKGEQEANHELLAQQAEGADESGMGFMEKLKRRRVESKPGIAQIMREHPGKSALVGAIPGFMAGGTLSQLLGIGQKAAKTVATKGRG